jgi:hypothetical protein
VKKRVTGVYRKERTREREEFQFLQRNREEDVQVVERVAPQYILASTVEIAWIKLI